MQEYQTKSTMAKKNAKLAWYGELLESRSLSDRLGDCRRRLQLDLEVAIMDAVEIKVQYITIDRFPRIQADN